MAIDVFPYIFLLCEERQFFRACQNSYQYTATITWKDIVQNKPANITFSDKYTVPNWGCAVVLSPDRQHITLYGGWLEKGNPAHHVYTAAVQDIVTNSGTGWTQVPLHWRLGGCLMFGYDTMKMTVNT